MIDRYKVEQIRSIWTDKNKFEKWYQVELAVLFARERLGHIPEGTTDSLKGATIDPGRIKEIEKETHHDVVAFINSISEQKGDSSRFLHQGLTSSDVVDTAFALLIKETSSIIKEKLDRVLEGLKDQAINYKGVPMIGRTHGVHGEPTSMGLKILSWYSEMKRSSYRFDRAAREMEYGKISGAMGNFAHLGPEIEGIALEKLGLKCEPVSTQIVPRDRYAEYQFAISTIGTAIERIAKEIRHLQRTEIRELEEPFRKGQKGSSAMPHKRNPIICERLSGMSRLLRSHLSVSLENISLWNERDISHSSTERIYIPDSTELITYMLEKMDFVVRNLNVYEENLKRNIYFTGGLVFSQKVLIELLDRGISREEAYDIVQSNAMEVWREGGDFRDKLKEDSRVKKVLSEEEIDSLFDTENFLTHEDKIFRRTLG